MDIRDKLLQLKDEEYSSFQNRLTPHVQDERFIGVRIPTLRKLTKEILKNYPEDGAEFINTLPHKYYDEDILHALLISEIRDFDKSIKEVNKFLPYVDNWAVCDVILPVCFKKHREELLPMVKEWIASTDEYITRFGILTLMKQYLDDDFKPEYLDLAASVRSEQYYVNMMIAWFFATALCKQWDAAVVYIEEDRLDGWVHNKAIRKARDSFILSKEQKAYLAQFRKSNKDR